MFSFIDLVITEPVVASFSVSFALVDMTILQIAYYLYQLWVGFVWGILYVLIE